MTLVELLVTIGIIAVLLATGWAMLGSAGERARDIQCVSHLRQIGVAMFSYAAEFKGLPPRYLGYYREQRPPGNQRAWYSRLYYFGYIKNPDLFYCPSFFPKNSREALTPVQSASGDTYGLRGWKPPGKDWEPESEEHSPLSAISEPADFFILADSVWLGWRSQGYGIAPGNKDQNVHFRHRGRANTLFADGHVEAKLPEYFRTLGSGRQAEYGTGRDFSLWEKPTVP